MKNYAQYLNNLPVMPDVAAKVLNLADSRDYSFQSIEDIVKLDAGLTTKVLRIANSAMYARQKEITKLQAAITLLGLKTIKNLVILAVGSSLFTNARKTPFYQVFWRHSIITAFMARDLARKTGRDGMADEAFVAGLLHNIGQVAFYYADPPAYEALIKESADTGKRISLLEEERFGTNHKMIGAQVLNGWNFPTVYTDTALEHGNNNITSANKQIIILVSTGDFLASNLDFRKASPDPISLLAPYVPFLGMSEEQLGEFAATYLETLNTDKLFKECQNMFKLDA